MLQLDLFHEFSEIDILEQKVRILEKSQDKLRKALFARHGKLASCYMELNDRFNVLERALCKGKFGLLE